MHNFDNDYTSYTKGVYMWIRIGVYISIAWWMGINAPSSQAKVQTGPELEIPAELEADYSEAVLNYQAGEGTKALAKLDGILRDHPENLKALELQGLILKSTEEYKESTQVFLKLLKLSRDLKVDEEKQLSYSFQIGTLLVQMQKYSKAKPFLSKCLKSNFNAPVSKFYLGIIAMEEGDLREAQSSFRSVVRSDVESLKGPSYFYLGVLAKRRKEDSLAESNWKSAKSLAEQTSRDPASAPSTRASAQQLLNSIDALLNTPAKPEGGGSAVFGSFGLATGYDSNVLLNPSVDIGATGQGTPTSTFRYSLGYAKSFGAKFQVMPIWQGSLNYNFNSTAAAGQFFSNDWNIWGTYQQGAFRYGLRTGASLILRNFVATGATSGILKKQSLSPTIGPNIRYEWDEHFAVGSEVVFASNTFYSEEALDASLQKTGWEVRWRNYYQNSGKSGWWNPTAELNLQYQYTEGTEFRSMGARSSLTNTHWWNDTFSSSLRAGLGYITYPSRVSEVRSDIELTTSLSAAYDVRKDIRLSTDFTYLNNISNITNLYKYNRWQVALAADYQF